MLVDVALPLPIPRTFTYRLEGGEVPEGTRVLVPFGRRRLIGWVVGRATGEVELERVLNVHEVLEETPSLPRDLFRLCQWVADYYLAPLGQVLRAALPSALADAGRRAPPVQKRRVIRLTRELPSLGQREEVFGRARRQRECYEFLEALGGSAEVAHLVGHVGFSPGVLKELVQKGLAEFVEAEVERDPFARFEPGRPPALVPTPAQRAVLDELIAAVRRSGGEGGQGAEKPFLLRGVTGSGKTLVYIELLKEVVERRGRGAIVLVPEISLTPQTVARFRAHFGDTVAVLHSGLSEGERYDAWRALRSGERKIAIGARSAVFAPIPDLGAIVVDEEHEGSYKQSEAPRYHAREVAIVRARLAGAVCLLGSATPSLESWHNARIGKYRLLELPERVEGRPLPPVRIIDLRQGAQGPTGRAEGAARVGGARPVLSEPLVAAIRERLERGEQTILLLNRRGYSTFVQCRDCGAVWHCQQCNVSLTYHRSWRRLVCHYCFHEELPPSVCDRCGSGDLSFQGVGTEQVEQAVVETFPTARVARMDMDTTSGKWSHHRILERVERGEVDILLGTQMIAKGLDFAGVTLVGVVNADVGLNLPDFRASERTFQLLTQVAGRAGRGPKGGEVLIQTALPGNYAIRAVLTHDYVGFAERELEERRGPGYPPHSRLVNVVVSGTEEVAVQEAAEAAAAWVRSVLTAHGATEVEVTGPAPCPIDRIRGRWRWHFLLRSRSARALSRICHQLHRRYTVRPGRADIRLILDRDPVALL